MFYPLIYFTGDASSSTVQIDTLKCTKYNSICQANVVLIRRLEPGRYYDFKVSVKDTKGGMTTQSCSITATNYTTPHDVIFPHKAGIIMVPEVRVLIKQFIFHRSFSYFFFVCFIYYYLSIVFIYVFLLFCIFATYFSFLFFSIFLLLLLIFIIHTDHI